VFHSKTYNMFTNSITEPPTKQPNNHLHISNFKLNKKCRRLHDNDIVMKLSTKMPIKGYNCSSSFEVRQNVGRTITTILLCVPQPTILRAYYSKFKGASTGSLKVFKTFESIIDFEDLFKTIQRLTQARYVVLQLLFNFMR